MAIVRDDHHRAFAFVQDSFQPANGIDIQVVGRLVQQQNIRITKQRLRQQHAQLPTRCHLAHRARVLFDRNANAHEQFAGACFTGVPVEFGELDFEFSDSHAVFFAHGVLRVQPIARFFHSPQFLVPHDHRVQNALFFKRELILAQNPEPFFGIERYIAVGGFKFAAEDFHQGGFAAPVGANQAISMTIAELNRDIFEQGLGTELNGDIGDG